MNTIVVKHYVDSDVIKDSKYIQVRYSYETGLITILRDGEKYEPVTTLNLVYGNTTEEHMYLVPEKLTDDEIINIDNKIQQVLQCKTENACINLAFIKYGTFDKYLKFLKNGNELSRKAWQMPQRSIMYRRGYTNTLPNAQTQDQWKLKKDECVRVLPHLQMKEGNTLKEYQLTLEDIMADDWYIVDKSHLIC